MIAGIFHQGSGLGDQLHRYITVRTLAEKKGYNWGMINHLNFKGDSFMQIEKFTKGLTQEGDWEMLQKEWNEKATMENGVDIRSYDPEINFVEDHTVIDGSFEDSKYWGHNLAAIGGWLRTESINIPDDVCVIGFRGGEYATVPELFLTWHYWDEAINLMYEKGIRKFEVHTDDPETAAVMLRPFVNPLDTKYIHDIGINWRSVRAAKHAIIANSAFYILPRLLRHHAYYHGGVTIAPRYWARRNLHIWARPACYYPQFTYI